MNCGNCGKELQVGDKFCMTCGWRVPEETVPVTNAAQPNTGDSDKTVILSATMQEPVQASVPQGNVFQGNTAPQTDAFQGNVFQGGAAPQAGAYQMGAAPQVSDVPKGKKPKKEKVKKEKSGKKGGLIVAAIGAVAVIAGGVAAAFNWDVVTNIIKSTFSSPQDYYASVEKDNFSNMAASAANAYQTLLREPMSSVSDMYESVTSGEIYEGGYKGEIVIELGDSAMENLMDTLSYQEELPFDISEWNRIALEYETYSGDSLINAAAGLTIGDTGLISVDTLLDYKDSALYLAIPELSESYLGISFEDVMADYEDALQSMEEMTEYLDAIQEIVKVLPDAKQAQALLTKYFDVIIGCVDDVDKESVKLEAGGVNQKCTCLKVTIDGKTLVKAAKALCKELKDDKDLKKYITDFVDAVSEQAEALDMAEELGMELDADEIYEQFQSMCDEILDTIDENEEEIPEFELVMSVYVDSKGHVCGREFELEVEEQTMTLLVANTENGSNVGFEASLSIDDGDGENGFVFEGSGKKNKGKLDGTYALTVMAQGEKKKMMNVSVKQFDLDALEKGYLNGSFGLSIADDLLEEMEERIPEEAYSMLEEMELVFDLTSNENAAKFKASLNQGKELYASLSISSEKVSDKELSVPSDAIMIEDIEDPEDSLKEYWMTIDWDSMIEKLEEIGLSDELIENLKYLIERVNDEM